MKSSDIKTNKLVAEFVGSLGVLNPAVAAGLSVFTLSYVVGPIIGTVVGANASMYLVADKK